MPVYHYTTYLQKSQALFYAIFYGEPEKAGKIQKKIYKKQFRTTFSKYKTRLINPFIPGFKPRFILSNRRKRKRMYHASFIF